MYIGDRDTDQFQTILLAIDWHQSRQLEAYK